MSLGATCTLPVRADSRPRVSGQAWRDLNTPGQPDTSKPRPASSASLGRTPGFAAPGSWGKAAAGQARRLLKDGRALPAGIPAQSWAAARVGPHPSYQAHSSRARSGSGAFALLEERCLLHPDARSARPASRTLTGSPLPSHFTLPGSLPATQVPGRGPWPQPRPPEPRPRPGIRCPHPSRLPPSLGFSCWRPVLPEKGIV